MEKEEKLVEGGSDETKDPVTEYRNSLMAKLNARYQSLNERLSREPNIILRYELKMALDELVTIYKELFGGN